MDHLPRLASLIFNQPHHITPEAAEIIVRAIGARLGVDAVEVDGELLEPESNAFAGRHVFDKDRGWKGYRITDKGVGIVQVRGELVNRGAWLGTYSGLVSYEGLRQTLRNAAADRDVKALLIDMDSPGGMAAGMLETSRLVARIAAEKPVHAVVNATMASAAYGVGAGATRIVASEVSHVGSIGTLIMHVDASKRAEKLGYKVTFVHAGAKKVDGNPYAPLPDSVRADLQARVEHIQDLFVEAVVAGRRGRVTEQGVRATEAATYLGREAVAHGLADSLQTFDETLAEVEADVSKPQSRVYAQQKGKQMDGTTGAPAANAPGHGFEGMTLAEFNEAIATLRSGLADLKATADQGQSAPAPAAVAAPPATAPEASRQGEQEILARGRSEERARIKAILTHTEAQGRQRQAQVIALGTDLPVDQAIALLKEMPAEQAAAGRTTAFYEAVAKSGGNPRVAHQGEAAPQQTTSTLADRMAARFKSRQPAIA